MKSPWIAILAASVLASPDAAQFNPQFDEGFLERKQAAEDYLLQAQIDALAARFREDLRQARAAYDRGNYALARRLWRPAADDGFPPAQYDLALMCERGQAGPRDDVAAARWLGQAARLGFGPAQFSLGMAYLDGRGVAKDERAGVKWLRLAADQNVAQAQYNLGVLYEYGEGVAKDPQLAADWYRKAAAGDAKR